MVRRREITAAELQQIVMEHPELNLGRLSMWINRSKEQTANLLENWHISVRGATSTPLSPSRVAEPGTVEIAAVAPTIDQPVPWVPPLPPDLISREAWQEVLDCFYRNRLSDATITCPREMVDIMVLSWRRQTGEIRGLSEQLADRQRQHFAAESALRSEMAESIRATESKARTEIGTVQREAGDRIRTERERISSTFAPSRVRVLENFQEAWESEKGLREEFPTLEEYARMALRFTLANRKTFQAQRDRIEFLEHQAGRLQVELFQAEGLLPRLQRASAALQELRMFTGRHYRDFHPSMFEAMMNALDSVVAVGLDLGDHLGTISPYTLAAIRLMHDILAPESTNHSQPRQSNSHHRLERPSGPTMERCEL